MHYYPEDQSEKNLAKIRDKNVCSSCGRELAIYLDMKTKSNYIACSGQRHEGIARVYKESGYENENSIRRLMEVEKTQGRETSTALQKLPTKGQLTKSEATDILKLVYPGVPDEEINRTAILCHDFGLHPLMKEVYIIPFGTGDKRTWTTVIGINATRKMMAQRGTFSYLDMTPRVMTEEEQLKIFGEVDTNNIIAITKLRTRQGEEAQGYGRWPKGASPYGTDKGNTKANMAFIRSERNAFGRLFTDALPQGIDIVDETYVEGVGAVDKRTGEILEEAEQNAVEGEFTEVEEKTELKAEAVGQEAPGPTEALITPEQMDELNGILKSNDMSLADFGKYCNAEMKWAIRKREDLTQKQFKEIQQTFIK